MINTEVKDYLAPFWNLLSNILNNSMAESIFPKDKFKEFKQAVNDHDYSGVWRILWSSPFVRKFIVKLISEALDSVPVVNALKDILPENTLEELKQAVGLDRIKTILKILLNYPRLIPFILEKTIIEFKPMNTMVLGKSGVGKSTLINNVFKGKFAKTGIGKPVTREIRQLKKPNFPLTIYDSPGFELGRENAIDEILKDVVKLIDEGCKSGKVETAIHCILYCISSASHVFEDAEKDFIKKLTSETSKYEIPVIIVLTKSYIPKDTEELKKAIENENLAIDQIIPVVAEDLVCEDNVINALSLIHI